MFGVVGLFGMEFPEGNGLFGEVVGMSAVRGGNDVVGLVVPGCVANGDGVCVAAGGEVAGNGEGEVDSVAGAVEGLTEGNVIRAGARVGSV